MTRSNVVVARQPSPQMKLPYQIHQPYHSHVLQHTSSASLSHSTASDFHSIPDNFVQHSSCPDNQSPDHQLHPFVKDEQLHLPSGIPSSVKGAPAHLRPAIRKRQNSESAKRSRQRRKEATKVFCRRFDEQCRRLSALEQKVATLIRLVKESNDDTAAEPRPKQEQYMVRMQATPAQQHQIQPAQPVPSPQCDRSNVQQSCMVQSLAAMTTSCGEEQQDSCCSPQIPLEEDIEALLETCIQSQHMFGSC